MACLCLSQHGLARDRKFYWSERGPRSCTLVLIDDAVARLHFPFAFRLAVTYAVEESQLDVGFEITNTGDEMLPAPLGAHPAFNWPLLPGLPKEAYGISFPARSSNGRFAPEAAIRQSIVMERR